MLQVKLTRKQQAKLTYSGERNFDFHNSRIKRLRSKYKIKKLKKLYPSARHFDHPIARDLSRIYLVEFGQDTASMALQEILSDQIFEESQSYEEPLAVPLHTPNDWDNTLPSVLENSYWHLENVNARTAWDFTKGSSDIKIAIIEPFSSWFKTNHEDLSSKIVYIDPGANSSSGKFNIHGTKVAGVAAAATNNNKGLASLGYNCKLMVYSDTRMDSYLDAAYRGARVINASYKSSCFYRSDHQAVFNLLADYGVVVVAASGNGNVGASCYSSDGQSNGLVYPAAYNNVISVTGYDINNAFVINSSNGHFTLNSNVDIAAPGHVIPSTSGNLSFSLSSPDTYGSVSGTSFAAPMVSATVGLMLSVNPDLKAPDVLNILKSTANPDILNTSIYPGNAAYVNKAGAGRLDANAAVRKAGNYAGFPIAWQSYSNVLIAGDQVIKTSGGNSWNAGAYSTNSFSDTENGSIEVTPTTTSGYRMFGLSKSDAGVSYNGIDYAFYLSGSSLKIYENGSFKGTFGSYSAGDVLSVKYEPIGQGIIYYYKNNQIVRQVTETSGSGSFEADISLYTQGTKLENVKYSHRSGPIWEGTSISWINTVKVSSNGGGIYKNHNSNWWNAGGASYQSIPANHNGFITTVASSTDNYKMIGLSATDPGPTWNTIKYNLYLSKYGDVKIYNSGSYVGTFGKYEVDDRFKILREDGYIMFFRNDVLLVGWEVNMNEKLLADACIYNYGAAIWDVRMQDLGNSSNPTGNRPDGGNPNDDEILSVDPEADTLGAGEWAGARPLMDSLTIAELNLTDPSIDSTNAVSDHFFNIYPNPLEHVFNLSAENKLEGPVRVTVSQFETGNRVRSFVIRRRDMINQVYTRRVGNIPAGLYVVNLYYAGRRESYTVRKN